MNEILKNLKVVEASAFIAAPFAGLTLAQMGADVIRIDPVGGGLDYGRWPVTKEGRSLYWAGLNKGKRSIALNVRVPEGREIAAALMTRPGPGAGVVLTNLPAQGWLDYEDLKRRRGDLIMVNITGNRDGSVALDYTINAATGFPDVTGPVDHDGPVNGVLPAWDLMAGLNAVSAVLAAERHRAATGEGQFVQLALADVAFSTLSHLGYVGEVQVNGADRPRTGNHVFGSFAHDFATRDGRRVLVTAFTPRHWSVLMEATLTAGAFGALEEKHGADLEREEDRFRLRHAIVDVLKPWFAGRTLAEAGAALDAAGACWGPYQTFRQAVEEDPRLSAGNPMFENVDHPGIGPMLTAGSVFDYSALPRTPAAPAPELGQHADEILSGELGLGAQEIARLHDTGIVGGP